MARTRKTPQTWIDAGIKALPEHGADGLRAETLARIMGTTKGSFYWHFSDVPTFQGAVLSQWQTNLIERFDNTISSGNTPVSRLRAVSGFHLTKLDHAVRGWAVQDKQAAKTVSRVDAALSDRIAALLDALDARHPDFPGLILASIIAAPAKGTQTETLIDLLLVLK